MIRKFGESDNKYKPLLYCIGHIIYMGCDENAQEVLARAEKSGAVNLEGRDDDITQQGIVQEIINIIAKDTPSERVRREVELLSNIQTCVRSELQTPEQFANRFNAAVARFSNQTDTLTSRESKLFAVLLIRNAKLTSDSLNALTLQLTTPTKEATIGVNEVSIPICRLSKIVDAVRYAAEHKDDQPDTHMNLIINETETLKIMIENSTFSESMFTLNQAVVALSQVKVHTRIVTQTTMLGKRKYESDYMAGAKRDSNYLLSENEATGTATESHALTGYVRNVIREEAQTLCEKIILTRNGYLSPKRNSNGTLKTSPTRTAMKMETPSLHHGRTLFFGVEASSTLY